MQQDENFLSIIYRVLKYIKKRFVILFCFINYYLLKFTNDSSATSITLQKNESIPLNVTSERQTGGRLTVLEDQTHKRRQEFDVKVKIKERRHLISFPAQS